MRALELFSGCGGLALGLKKSGFLPVGFVEFNKHACETLKHNFESDIVHHVDVRDVDFKDYVGVDLIAGGPPCQPFSLGGRHKGENDARDMFPYAIKAITVVQPKAFIFENVKGLLRAGFSEYFEYVLLRLQYPSLVTRNSGDWKEDLKRIIAESTGQPAEYNVKFKLINSMNYGVPQARERVFIIGFREGFEWSFPKETHSRDALLWDQLITNKYWERHNVTAGYDFDHRTRSQTLKRKYGFFEPQSEPALTVRDALYSVPAPSQEENIRGHLLNEGARVYPGHTGSFIDLPAKTIKAGDHGVPGGENMIRFHNGDVRYFTSYEAKLIQTFPNDYYISGTWGENLRQIGNAVPVKVAEIIGSSVYDALSKNNG